MGWLRLVGSINLQVSFAKEPYKRDDILQKRPVNSSILLTVATPYHISVRTLYDHVVSVSDCFFFLAIYLYLAFSQSLALSLSFALSPPLSFLAECQHHRRGRHQRRQKKSTHSYTNTQMHVHTQYIFTYTHTHTHTHTLQLQQRATPKRTTSAA